MLGRLSSRRVSTRHPRPQIVLLSRRLRELYKGTQGGIENFGETQRVWGRKPNSTGQEKSRSQALRTGTLDRPCQLWILLHHVKKKSTFRSPELSYHIERLREISLFQSFLGTGQILRGTTTTTLLPLFPYIEENEEPVTLESRWINRNTVLYTWLKKTARFTIWSVTLWNQFFLTKTLD